MSRGAASPVGSAAEIPGRGRRTARRGGGAAWSLLLAAGILLAAPAPAPGQQAGENVVRDAALFQALTYRMIGPHRGGRVTAVTGYADRATTFLMGTVGGGLWRTTDAGQSWENLTDGHLGVGPVGAVAVAPSDPEVIWLGTGSGGVRGNVSVGDGVYRSTDGGKSWVHLGLAESGHIHEIAVDPRDADRAYLTALGHIFGPNPERGVYRTIDGGATWEKVLHVSERAGAIDLVMSPENPRVLYAATWEAERKPWAMFSGGEGSGIFKSTDGGDSWTELATGLPEKPLGRIGLAVSPADPDRVWALVEAEGDARGLYRSDDGGASFRHLTDDRNLTARPWYYMHVDAHPTDRNTLYVSGEGFYRSVDGGTTWASIRTPHGDHHALWINPDHPEIMVQGNDGGATVTFNAGETWSTQLNQPTAELYTVVVDEAFPYRVYAPQQDNSTISLPSRVTRGITPYEEWFAAAGCETGPLALDPEDSDIIYGGCKGRISRLHLRTGQERAIWVYPLEYHGRSNQELRYRRQWNSQIRFSPHDPDVLYHPSQVVHRSTDEGQSWEVISPDLTRWDEHEGLHVTPPGGPLTYDQTGVEIYGTIFAFEGSPHEPGVLWAGSDDGRVSLSRDGGATWSDVTPEGMELHTTVNEIVISPHRAGRAFVVAHRYRMDDFRPFLYSTDDYGRSWRLLTDGTNGVPADHPTRAVQEDPDRPGLLYLGTEFGLFVSLDDGERWQPLQLDLPRTPVTDLVVHRKDLVVATQGRSLWILDDLTPLHQLTGEVAASRAHLFRPRDAYRQRLAYEGEGRGAWPDNPPGGALLHYYLSEDAGEGVTLEVLDDEGEVIRRWSGASDEGSSRLPTGPGTHRVAWDLRYPEAFLAEGVHEARYGFRERIAVVTGFTGGPLAVPGTYRVRLTLGDGTEQTRELRVRPDPRLAADGVTVEDMRANFELAIRVRDRITSIQRMVTRIHAALDELRAVERRVEDAGARKEARRLQAALDDVAGELYKHGERGDHAHLHPELTTSYARLGTMLDVSDHRPTDSAHERFRDLEPEYAELMRRVEGLLGPELTAFNQALTDLGVQPVQVPGG